MDIVLLAINAINNGSYTKKQMYIVLLFINATNNGENTQGNKRPILFYHEVKRGPNSRTFNINTGLNLD